MQCLWNTWLGQLCMTPLHNTGPPFPPTCTHTHANSPTPRQPCTHRTDTGQEGLAHECRQCQVIVVITQEGRVAGCHPPLGHQVPGSPLLATGSGVEVSNAQVEGAGQASGACCYDCLHV
jgi:hypothetical protein